MAQRDLKQWWPGKITTEPWSARSGQRHIVFTGKTYEEASEKMNKFFEEGAAKNEAYTSTYASTIPATDGLVGFHCYYTQQVSVEEMNRFNEFHRRIAEAMEKEDADTARKEIALQEAMEKQTEERRLAAEKEERETRRLADLGRVHERNCKKEKK